MIARIDEARRKAGDSLGGVVRGVARGVPPGWGEPVFDKLEADLAKAMLSLPAAKGFEIGSGFAGTRLHGREHNDPFYRGATAACARAPTARAACRAASPTARTSSLRVAFKPTATILREQETVDVDGERDDDQAARAATIPCVLPRAVPIVEAMMALVLADHALRQRGQCG